MRFLSAFLTLVFLLVACLGIRALDRGKSQPPSIGRLVVEAGAIQITRAGKTAAVKQRATLYQGDVVTIGAKGSASITQVATRKAWSVNGPARVRISSNQVSSKPPENLKLVYTGNYPARPVTTGPISATTVVRGDPDGQLRPLGSVAEKPVVLTWKGLEGTGILAAKIVAPKGGIAWETTIENFQGDRLAIPGDRLQAGAIYRAIVRVTQIRESGQLVENEWETQFVVLGAAQVKQLEADVAAAKDALPPSLSRVLAVADVLAAYGRLEELENWLRLELKSAPSGERAFYMGEYLERMGFKKAAIRSYQAAREAGYRSPDLTDAISRLSSES